MQKKIGLILSTWLSVTEQGHHGMKAGREHSPDAVDSRKWLRNDLFFPVMCCVFFFFFWSLISGVSTSLRHNLSVFSPQKKKEKKKTCSQINAWLLFMIYRFLTHLLTQGSLIKCDNNQAQSNFMKFYTVMGTFLKNVSQITLNVTQLNQKSFYHNSTFIFTWDKGNSDGRYL